MFNMKYNMSNILSFFGYEKTVTTVSYLLPGLDSLRNIQLT